MGWIYRDPNGNEVPFYGGSGGQAIQVDTLPTASASLEGTIYQYVGATGNGFTNGYL